MTAQTALIVPPLMHPEGPHTALLRAAGFEVRRLPDGVDSFRPEELGRLLADVDAVLAGTEPYTRDVLARAPRLRVIVRFGVGYDAIDLTAADAQGIAVATTPATNHEAVAEHTLAMIMALARGFPRRDLMVRRGDPWQKLPLPRLAGRRLGLIGLGRIARSLVRKLPGLELHVLAHSRNPDPAFAAAHAIELTTLDGLLERSDIVSLHVPVTPATRRMVDEGFLARMKRGAILVNTSRGALVDEQALHRALAGGHLAAAGLDVFAAEPPPRDHPLLQLDNVLLSPHVAGLDEVSYRDLQTMAAHVVIDLSQGRRRPDCVVNLKDAPDWRW